MRAHRQNNERKPSFHIQTTPPHEIYALPFNENFCVQFIHIMKHYVLYLWFLGLCFMFRLFGSMPRSTGWRKWYGDRWWSIGKRFMRVCVISNGILRDFCKNRRKIIFLTSCFASPNHNSTEHFHNQIVSLQLSNYFSFMSRTIWLLKFWILRAKSLQRSLTIADVNPHSVPHRNRIFYYLHKKEFKWTRFIQHETAED